MIFNVVKARDQMSLWVCKEFRAMLSITGPTGRTGPFGLKIFHTFCIELFLAPIGLGPLGFLFGHHWFREWLWECTITMTHRAWSFDHIISAARRIPVVNPICIDSKLVNGLKLKSVPAVMIARALGTIVAAPLVVAFLLYTAVVKFQLLEFIGLVLEPYS